MRSVAVDVQGPAVVRPWVDAAGATFPVTVDASGLLAERFALDIVRVALLFDADATLAGSPLRIDVDEDAELVDAIGAWLDDAGPLPASDDAGDANDDARAAAVAWWRVGEMALDDGDREAAAAALDEAWRLLPDNLQLRKQRWALRHPDRFYDGDIDLAWQAELRAEGR